MSARDDYFVQFMEDCTRKGYDIDKMISECEKHLEELQSGIEVLRKMKEERT